MLIITQDEKAIHNLDNILSIQVEGKRIVVYDCLNDNTSLGTYKSEARAIEILKDISKFYCGQDYYGHNDIVGALARIARKTSVYEMPDN